MPLQYYYYAGIIVFLLIAKLRRQLWPWIKGEDPKKILPTWIEGCKKIFVIKEKSDRFEYWSFVLVNIFLLVALGSISIYLSNILSFIYYLSLVSITIRRLRDLGKNWKWIFLIAIPLVGWFFTLFWFLKPSPEWALKNADYLAGKEKWYEGLFTWRI